MARRGGRHYRRPVRKQALLRGAIALVAAASIAAIGTACTSGSSGGTAPAAAATLTGWSLVQAPPHALEGESEASFSALCPAGKVVTGGGARASDEAINVFASAPLPDGSGWRISVKNENINIDDTLLSVAVEVICVDRPQGYRIDATSVDVGAQGRVAGSAVCPDPTLLLAGGGANGGESAIHITSSAPRTDRVTWATSWRSTYLTAASSRPRTFSICAGAFALPGLTVAVSPSSDIGPRSSRSLAVTCPPGTRPLSGGAITNSGVAMINDNAPVAGGGGWTATVHNPQSILDPVTVTARTLVMCAAAIP